MNRLFRQPDSRLPDYAALALFAAAYLATMAMILAPVVFDAGPANGTTAPATTP